MFPRERFPRFQSTGCQVQIPTRSKRFPSKDSQGSQVKIPIRFPSKGCQGSQVKVVQEVPKSRLYRRFPSKGSTSFLRLPRFPWRRFPQGFQVKVPEKRFSSKGSYTVLKVPKGTSYMLPQGSQVKVPTRLPRFGYVFAVSPIFYISCFLPFARLVGGICQSCFLAVGDILWVYFTTIDGPTEEQPRSVI